MRNTLPLSNPSALMLDNQLCFALYSSSLAMTKVYKPYLESIGLTYPQYLVMLLLWENDRQSVSNLGDRLFLDSGTLTPLLKRMEQSGWIVRVRCTDDERRVLISLTDAGRTLQSSAARIPDCIIESAGCPVPELVTLTRQLQKLRSRLTT